MKFRDLAYLCERLEATTKRNFMVSIVADFLKHLSKEEVEPVISMMLGRPFPKWDPRKLDVSWATLSKIILRLTGTDWRDLSAAAFRNTGDLGVAAKIIFENRKKQRQTTLFERPLSILEVRNILEAVAEASGQGSRERKERLIESLLGRALPIEVKYLVKIMVGEMRTGLQEGLMETAVSKAFSIPIEKIRVASMLTGDIAETAAICAREGAEGLLKLGFKIFRPVKPMLAQMAENPEEALKEHGGKTAFEYKLDGARIQIHKSGGKVRIFSRRLTDVTKSLPDIVEIIKRRVKLDEAILEGEVIAIGKNGNPLPFQHLMRRFRRVCSIEKMVEEIPVELYLFDIIYMNGESLINLPYVERRRKLSGAVSNISLTKQMITSSPKEAEHFLEEAINNGHEGLMAKRLNSPYIPGIRGKHWLKIKRTLEPLDLVIVAAEYGTGRRHGWLSDYYLAARDEKTGEFLTIGKTFKGLTDREIEEMTERLKRIVVEEKGHIVIVKPKIVVEVAYNEIQESPKYKSRMALRFARITRIRDDKSPEEADTIKRVRWIYEQQFLRKSKFSHIG
ncbi:ATP-dependent DNA ligase [Candidatus Bathyarchaeota archaeon]|nr:MAG: ATP-dependent DNA ligase [Candidatus Bathyarchaeota archaeon]